jgi:diguanylate cyclase (GGDEF)-like protein
MNHPVTSGETEWEIAGGDQPVGSVPQPGADSLTSLPGRDEALARLRAAEEADGDTEIAVLYIDVDYFKRVNDRVGHGGGDAVLQAVADRLRAAVRPGDVVSRFGGDEFVVVASGVAGVEAATVIAERIRSGVSEPVRIDGRRLSVTVSIGVAVGPGGLGRALLEQADTALYRAKESGRDRVETFRAGDRLRGSRQVRPETVLAATLDRGGLRVAYEPIVDLTTGSVAAMRVSLRALAGGDDAGGSGFHVQDLNAGADADEGSDAGSGADTGEDTVEGSDYEDMHEHPEALLRLAEESGLIVSLGAGLLDAACTEACNWPRGDDGWPAVSLVWPMTARQLEEPRSADQVLGILEGRGLAPGWLAVELNEESLTLAGPVPRRTVARLKDGGVRITVGGFGEVTGSISLLREFPIDTLVIGPAFLEGLGSDSSRIKLVNAVLAFGRLLDIDIAVAGVSTETEVTLLKALGCRWASGPYFGAPSPDAAMLRRIN